MKAAGRQQDAATAGSGAGAGKQNGDVKRRPSYPGEQRVKHANMSSRIWVKVAMAVAYFFSVSVAAVVLVIYYVFFWTPDATHNVTGGAQAANLSAKCALASG